MAEAPTHPGTRPSQLRKGEWGRVLVLAGSSQLAGAAVLNTLGALRTGVDLVVTAAPQRAADAVLHAAPDAVTLSIPSRRFEINHYKIIDHFKGYAVVIGSGITTQSHVKRFLQRVLQKFPGPFVLDADAVRIVSQIRKPNKLWAGKTVLLMPNRVEYDMLMGQTDSDPKTTIAELAVRLQATILATGPVDYLSDGQGVAELPGGSAFLAKAGTGDVLAGMVGALLARGLNPVAAAKQASDLLDAASLRAEKERGAGMLASDVAQAINRL